MRQASWKNSGRTRSWGHGPEWKGGECIFMYPHTYRPVHRQIPRFHPINSGRMLINGTLFK